MSSKKATTAPLPSIAHESRPTREYFQRLNNNGIRRSPCSPPVPWCTTATNTATDFGRINGRKESVPNLGTWHQGQSNSMLPGNTLHCPATAARWSPRRAPSLHRPIQQNPWEQQKHLPTPGFCDRCRSFLSLQRSVASAPRNMPLKKVVGSDG